MARERRKHWDHRIVRHEYTTTGNTTKGPKRFHQVWYGVHECFYGNTKKAGARGVGWTQTPNDVTGETPKQAVDYLLQMLRDLTPRPGRKLRRVIRCVDCGPACAGNQELPDAPH